MTRYEFWLSVHLATVIVWLGGSAIIQVLGVRTRRSTDAVQIAAFAGDLAWVFRRVFLPCSVPTLTSGLALRHDLHWDWSQPFIVFGLGPWTVVSVTAFGLVAPTLARAAAELGAESSNTAVAGRIRTITRLSQVLVVLLFATVFMMSVELGT